jgi:transposase-like protein
LPPSKSAARATQQWWLGGLQRRTSPQPWSIWSIPPKKRDLSTYTSRAREVVEKCRDPVFGMVERGRKVKTYHLPKVNRHHVIDKIKDNISIEADAVYTDDSRLYERMPQNVRKHEIVNHSAKEWVREDVHTGTIDGYWGLLKRGVIGSFHEISIKHLHRYLSEFQFRWNNRKNAETFLLVIAAVVIASALPYKQLIASVDEEPDAGAEVSLDDEPF